MPKNSAQLLELEHPYEYFKDADVLAEHQEELNGLKPEQMKALAIKIMQQCPNEHLRDFGRQIESIKEPGNPNPTFYSTLSKAHQVSARLHSIIDPQNPKPNNYFLGAEFYPELFHEFPELSQTFFMTHKKALSTLIMSTQSDDLNSLANNMRTAFNKNPELLEKMNGAMTLRREIMQHLLSDNPENFFTSKEVNTDLCNEFSDILNQSIAGQETAIGKKLAQKASDHHGIHRTLEAINPSAKDENSPLRKLATAITTELEKDQGADSESEASHQSDVSDDEQAEAKTAAPEGKPSAAGMFAAAQDLRQRRIGDAGATAEVPSVACPTAKPEKKDDNCCSRLFGM